MRTMMTWWYNDDDNVYTLSIRGSASSRGTAMLPFRSTCRNTRRQEQQRSLKSWIKWIEVGFGSSCLSLQCGLTLGGSSQVWGGWSRAAKPWQVAIDPWTTTSLSNKDRDALKTNISLCRGAQMCSAQLGWQVCFCEIPIHPCNSVQMISNDHHLMISNDHHLPVDPCRPFQLSELSVTLKYSQSLPPNVIRLIRRHWTLSTFINLSTRKRSWEMLTPCSPDFTSIGHWWVPEGGCLKVARNSYKSCSLPASTCMHTHTICSVYLYIYITKAS